MRRFFFLKSFLCSLLFQSLWCGDQTEKAQALCPQKISMAVVAADKKLKATSLEQRMLSQFRKGVIDRSAERRHLPGGLYKKTVAPSIQRLNQALKNADLRGADLHGFDLSGLDLAGVGFERANLKGADLTQTDLSYATLIATSLEHATLESALLLRTDCLYVRLKGANLRKTLIHQSRFYRASLEGANLTRANLSQTDFREADFTDADFSRAHVVDVDCRGVCSVESLNCCPYVSRVILTHEDWDRTNLECSEIVIREQGDTVTLYDRNDDR